MKKKPKKSQKKNNYTKQKYPALNARYQVGNRKELIDYDYIDKLSPEEKDWLDRFTSEYVVTNFNHRGEQLFTDDEDKRALYRENNKRNSDVFSVSKANGLLQYGYRSSIKTESHESKGISENSHLGADENFSDEEDYMLTLLTLKKVIKKDDQ